jgi:hypothetical protein
VQEDAIEFHRKIVSFPATSHDQDSWGKTKAMCTCAWILDGRKLLPWRGRKRRYRRGQRRDSTRGEKPNSLPLLPLERIAAAKLSSLLIAEALERADRPAAAAPAARRSNACSVLGFSPATTATVDWCVMGQGHRGEANSVPSGCKPRPLQPWMD